MNLHVIRTGIRDALAQRPAFADIACLLAYPAGDLAEWRSGFVIGTASGTPDYETLDGRDVTRWNLTIGIWAEGTGAIEADFEQVEATAFALAEDFDQWIAEVAGGKTWALTGVAVDSIVIARWDVSYTAAPGCEIELSVDIDEVH